MACKGGTFQSGEDKYYPNAYYEIGDLFFTTRSENPNLRFGGTWELYGKGKVLVCVDPDDSDFSTVKKTGGEKTHTLTGEERGKTYRMGQKVRVRVQQADVTTKTVDFSVVIGRKEE